MIEEKMTALRKCLAQISSLKMARKQWLKEYLDRPLVERQYLAQHLSAGQSLAASILTALLLSNRTDIVQQLFYSHDEGSERDRNFPFYYAHLILSDLLSSWSREYLFGLKEGILQKDAEPGREMEIVLDLLDALSCSNQRVAKKLAFLRFFDADVESDH